MLFKLTMLKIEPLKPPLGLIYGIRYRYGEERRKREAKQKTENEQAQDMNDA